MVLFVRSDIAFSNPIAGTPMLPPPPFTSDTFDRENSLALGMTDAKMGGTSKPWVGTLTAFKVENKQAVIKGDLGATFFTGVEVDSLNVETSFVIREKPVGDLIWLDVRRPLSAVTPTQDGIRLSFETSSTLIKLSTRINNTGANYGTYMKYALGDRIGMRVVGTNVKVLVNGVVMMEETISDPALQVGRHVGFAGTQKTTTFAFDDFLVSPILA